MVNDFDIETHFRQKKTGLGIGKVYKKLKVRHKCLKPPGGPFA